MKAATVFDIPYSADSEEAIWFDELEENKQEALLEWFNIAHDHLTQDDLEAMCREDIQFKVCDDCGAVEVDEGCISDWGSFQGVASHNQTIISWVRGHAEGDMVHAENICGDCR